MSPVGFTIPVEGFASSEALSPDGRWLAVLSQDGNAVDVLSLTSRPGLAERLSVQAATGMSWTTDGLFVTRGYSGTIARYAYDPSASKRTPSFAKQIDIQVGTSGLLNGITVDPATHRLAVARTADQQVVVMDDQSGATLATLPTSGQPFAVAFAGGTLFATLYNSDHVEAWRDASGDAVHIPTGPHPTQMLADGDGAYVANADGHDVVRIDARTLAVTQRFDLAPASGTPPGQTPSGMALSSDHNTLYVAESGLNDVAVVDLASGRVRGRIPTAWYPTAVVAVGGATTSKDPRNREQLWVASAKGLGSQPNPGGEWDGTYTGLVQHLVVEPEQFATWTAQVARNDRLGANALPHAALPPIEHVVFIVRENKHFDEEFADQPNTNGDSALLLFGRRYTPNAHALADRYALFDNFMTDGEASIYGHAWTTQGMANDYHERNAHLTDDSYPEIAARVATAIWPYPLGGEDSVKPATMNWDWFTNLAALPSGPRINVSGVFGPRGELVDELRRKHVSFRVYGEQLTMLPDGSIAPGLVDNADKAYPGDHIDFGVLDTDRAKLFLDDVAAHGLAHYSYITLPDDHTAGTRPGFYTPASYVANNDQGLGRIIAGLSHRPDWRNTVVFVTCDDAQGTGDHVDSHRMPALAIGPYVRRDFVDHTHYSQTSILRTVELLFGLQPLNVYDAAATPIVAAFAKQPLVASFSEIKPAIAMEMNPGKAVSSSQTLPIDGPDAAAIADQDWASLHGT
ncbi:MAG: bifunctional YncE family protein/alkaline phosphatase family protein, partial [Candidatus Eremiobacteraeota bacterium]|nr:bifunctional YncE family protein/alkaline phosphatase family protein [Candidatus Eremiobacteraeota bacterium]